MGIKLRSAFDGLLRRVVELVKPLSLARVTYLRLADDPVEKPMVSLLMDLLMVLKMMALLLGT